MPTRYHIVDLERRVRGSGRSLAADLGRGATAEERTLTGALIKRTRAGGATRRRTSLGAQTMNRSGGAPTKHELHEMEARLRARGSSAGQDTLGDTLLHTCLVRKSRCGERADRKRVLEEDILAAATNGELDVLEAQLRAETRQGTVSDTLRSVASGASSRRSLSGDGGLGGDLHLEPGDGPIQDFPGGDVPDIRRVEPDLQPGTGPIQDLPPGGVPNIGRIDPCGCDS